VSVSTAMTSSPTPAIVVPARLCGNIAAPRPAIPHEYDRGYGDVERR
jgi:hypothetical protein